MQLWPTSLRLACGFALLIGLISAASAIERMTIRRDGREIDVVGRSLLTAQDGGRLLLARTGQLWLIPPDEQVGHTSDGKPFLPLARDDMSKAMLAELPDGFRVHATTHYLIYYNTSQSYAQWCGALFERLYRAFTNFWSRKGFELREPQFPLVAVVFADRNSYMKYADRDLGNAKESVIGYYGLLSNRMTMYDLTGFESQGHGRLSTAAQINQVLSRPDAAQTVSTIVHEATHQIAFNCGLHQRLSDCPRWFSEGIAMYFETPDLRSAKGWSGIGAVNRPRLERFQQHFSARSSQWLETLVRDDKRFVDTKHALDAYAEAWALTYFLLNQRSKEYVGYLRGLSEKKALIQDGSDGRLEEFRNAFGDLTKLNTEFARYMSRAR